MKKFLFCISILSLQFSVGAQTAVKLFYDQPGKDTIVQVAKTLEAQLNRSTPVSITYSKENDFDKKGILLSDQPQKWKKYSGALSKMGVEAVVVKNTDNGIVIIGNSQLAVQHGIFIYLETLGYRYYFPNPDWYIIPAISTLFPKIDYAGEPSFIHRRVWYSYGTGSVKAEADYNFWFKANKFGSSVYANFGHAYDDIVYRNWDEFKKHPDWFFPRLTNPNVMPPDPKFNLADESLLQFVIQDVFKRIEAKKQKGDQSYKMISMMPSDGLGTCNSPACMKLGATITDRVFYFSNRVAKAIRQKYPDVWVGGMSYGEYSEPPTTKLEPNTYVNIATAFSTSKYSTDDLIRLWSAKAGKTGIYDYLSLYNWDWDMPGQSQAAQPTKYINTLKKFYALGIRGFEAETNVGINKGLGHYFTGRLLWNINDDCQKQEAEFFKLCFGNLAEDVKKIWKEWENYGFKAVREKDLAGWIDGVAAAAARTTDTKIKKRLFQMKAYLYYIVLYNKFMASKTEENRVTLLSYCYRMTDYACFAGYPALWDLGNGTGLAGFTYNDPNAKYKLNKTPVTEAEIEQGLSRARAVIKTINGLKQFPLTAGFKLAPGADKWKGAIGNGSDDNNSLWMGADYLIRISKAGKENFIDFKGGFAKTSDKPIKITITAYSSDPAAVKKVVLYHEYSLMEGNEKISLETFPAGLYVINVVDYAKIFKPHFSPSIDYSLLISPKQQLKGYANHLFIYVPAGVTKFSVLKYEAKFQTPTGRIVDLANKIVEEVEVEVKPGEQGLWKLFFFSGELYFEGLPPVMGALPDRMLIPDNIK